LKKRRRRHTCGYLQRRGPEAGLDVPVSCQAARKRAFFEFSLCLSRACLGKKMTFICKWLKSPFSHRYLRAETGEPASEVLMHGTDSQKYEIECSGKGGDHSPCSRGGGRSERSPASLLQRPDASLYRAVHGGTVCFTCHMLYRSSPEPPTLLWQRQDFQMTSTSSTVSRVPMMASSATWLLLREVSSALPGQLMRRPS
jgi:hypothetical protein